MNDWPTNLAGAITLISGMFFFKKAIVYLPLSVTIVLWSGMSLFLTIVFDFYFFKTKLSWQTACAMAFCIISIIGLNYFSTIKTAK